MANMQNRFLIESYQMGNTWYRKFNDGWIEQGGLTTSTTVIFPVAFVNTEYTLLTQNISTSATWGDANRTDYYAVKNLTLTSFQNGTMNQYSSPKKWFACGYYK